MFGAIIGDIIGSIYEFNNYRDTDFPFIVENSFFTDDTVCTVAVMDWLLHANEKNGYSATRYMLKWTRKYPNAGYGGRFRKWIFSEEQKPYGSYGNGAAMRISPVAWFTDNASAIEQLSDIVTGITHNHPEGMKAARVVSNCIKMALRGCTKNDIWNYAIGQYPQIENFEYEMLRQLYEFNETSQDTVPQAIYCFLISNSYEDCIRKTISIGGDSDTLAAISGGIAEAYWGIPEYWVERFRSKLDHEMLQVIDEFYLKNVNIPDSRIFNRFLIAQRNTYDAAISELKAGKKTRHWMWYIFPQIKGLGESENSEYYGLNGLRQAALYYNNHILSKRLLEACRVLNESNGSDIKKILGFPDYKKLQSCMTLFYLITRDQEFKKVIDKYYAGEFDHKTMILAINHVIKK